MILHPNVIILPVRRVGKGFLLSNNEKVLSKIICSPSHVWLKRINNKIVLDSSDTE